MTQRNLAMAFWFLPILPAAWRISMTFGSLTRQRMMEMTPNIADIKQLDNI